MFAQLLLFCLIAMSACTEARKVFCHYLVSKLAIIRSIALTNCIQVGTVTEAHAQDDIRVAQAMEIDAFALNIGDPKQPFVRETLNYLFRYADRVGFKLFISMDLIAAGTSGKQTLANFYPLFRDFKGRPSWYLGPNNKPFISTFSDGGLTNSEIIQWKNTLAYDMYFVPNLDGTEGYSQGADGWHAYWDSIIDGAMGWESAWPEVGGFNDGDVSVDNVVVKALHAHGKSFIMRKQPFFTSKSHDFLIYRTTLKHSLNLISFELPPVQRRLRSTSFPSR
jgi:glucan endo-1,3-alpha-glucosidase